MDTANVSKCRVKPPPNHRRQGANHRWQGTRRSELPHSGIFHFRERALKAPRQQRWCLCVCCPFFFPEGASESTTCNVNPGFVNMNHFKGGCFPQTRRIPLQKGTPLIDQPVVYSSRVLLCEFQCWDHPRCFILPDGSGFPMLPLLLLYGLRTKIRDPRILNKPFFGIQRDFGNEPMDPLEGNYEEWRRASPLRGSC